MIYILIFIVFLIFIIFAFSTLRKKRAAAFPVAWDADLVGEVRFYRKLSQDDRKLFQGRMMNFLSEVNIEGVGLELLEKDRMLVAASAVIPVFGFKEWYYNNLSTVLVYPDHFNEDLNFSSANKEKRNIAGMVGTGSMENQMILSKKALYHGFSNDTDKGNTAVHEFVHLMDKTDGLTDGIPERLLQRQYIAPWLELMHKEMEAINEDRSDIRNYGGTSKTEFFAVASEYFFERPQLFKRKHPELYEMLAICFQQKLN